MSYKSLVAAVIFGGIVWWTFSEHAFAVELAVFFAIVIYAIGLADARVTGHLEWHDKQMNRNHDDWDD